MRMELALTALVVLTIIFLMWFSLSNKNKELYATTCDIGTISLQIVTENKNPFELGPQRFLELQLVSGKNKRTIDRFGTDRPKGTYDHVALDATVGSQPETGAWDVIVLGTSFSAGEYVLLTDCLKKNVTGMNTVLATTNLKKLDAIMLSQPKIAHVAIASAQYLPTVRASDNVAISSDPQNDSFDFVCNDGSFFRIWANNTVWDYGASSNSLIGHIDVRAKTLTIPAFRDASALIPRLSSCKNAEGKTLGDLYTLTHL